MDATSPKSLQLPSALLNVPMQDLYQTLMLAIPHILADEIARDDAVVHDPVMPHLVSDVGAMLFAHDSGEFVDSSNFVVLCAHLAERVLATRHTAIRQIVHLDMGLNTHAYWMSELKDCAVFHLHSNPAILDAIQRALDETNAKRVASACHFIPIETGDESWPGQLLARGFDPDAPTLWMVGELFVHIAKPLAQRFLAQIDAMSAPGSQLYAVMCSGMRLNITMGETPVVPVQVGSQGILGDDASMFGGLGAWPVELLLRRDAALQYYGSMWDDAALGRLCVKDTAFAMLGPCYAVRFSKLAPPA